MEFGDGQNEDTIVLDGSAGCGALANLVIVTKGPTGEEEKSFQVPYAVVNQDTLKKLTDINLIRGYRITKIEGPEGE